MTEENEKQLKQEISHIFDSGANEIRIFEMVKRHIKLKYESKLKAVEDENTSYLNGYSNGIAEGIRLFKERTKKAIG